MTRTSPGPIFDAHHHLWHRGTSSREGILGEKYLDRDFLWPDLVEAADGHRICGTCMVEALGTPEEVDLAETTSAAHPTLRTMIAHAPVESPSLDRHLGRLQEHRMVRGVRRSTQAEADPEFVLRPEFVAGARLVGEKGLLLEVCVRHGQLAAVPRLAKLCPETVIVVQHLGKPDVSKAPPEEWLHAMAELGACANAWCKVSPVVHTASDVPFTSEAQAPFIQHVVSCLGWERLLFGSNWPVLNAVTTYGDWIEIVAGAQATATDAELASLFRTNGERLYSTTPAAAR